MAEVVWIGILILAALAAVAIGYGVWRGRRSARREALRRRFGREYDRAVEETGSGEAARRELRARLRRVSRLPLRPLSPRERESYREAFEGLESRFVDDPLRAVAGLDRLTQEVLLARGYPNASFERQLADLSVHHARIVEHYRAARAIGRRSREDGASTEQLRRAATHYRAVLAELLDAPLPSGRPRQRTLYA